MKKNYLQANLPIQDKKCTYTKSLRPFTNRSTMRSSNR